MFYSTAAHRSWVATESIVLTGRFCSRLTRADLLTAADQENAAPCRFHNQKADQGWVDGFYSGFLELARKTATPLAGGHLELRDRLACDASVSGAVLSPMGLRPDYRDERPIGASVAHALMRAAPRLD